MKDTVRNEMGRVRISDEAVAEIASIAAMSVDGVAGMGAGSRMDAFAEALGVAGPGRGVQVRMRMREVDLELTILVEFGADIAETAVGVQEAVAREVEKMTGLEVREVDVNVQGVQGARGN